MQDYFRGNVGARNDLGWIHLWKISILGPREDKWDDLVYN